MITVETIQQVAHQGPFFPNWQSLGAFVLPEWFRKAKFGVFIHWGLYSVPAFHNEWYSRNMYIKGHPEYDHHIETYGPQKNFGYKDFIPMFTADKFDQLLKEMQETADGLGYQTVLEFDMNNAKDQNEKRIEVAKEFGD